MQPQSLLAFRYSKTIYPLMLFLICFSQDKELRMALYELAKKEGVVFRFNTKVVDVEPGSGIVTLADGKQLSTDLVVAADGFYSFIRKYVVENENEEAEEAIGSKKMVLVSVSLPLEKLLNDEILQPLSNPSLVRVLIIFCPVSCSLVCSGRFGWVMVLLVEAASRWASILSQSTILDLMQVACRNKSEFIH
jgi:2-polyprenyl-6-methoxyphenol hydroxylase-like FAD-dependent oxidoreductase